jgi:hypothetical protein
MAAFQSLIGCIGNEDGRPPRGVVLCLSGGRIQAEEPGLYEAGQPKWAAFFRNGIDDMLKQIGSKAPANVGRLDTQLVRGDNRIFEEAHSVGNSHQSGALVIREACLLGRLSQLATGASLLY